MLNRDFSKSKRDYIAKNKISLIIVGIIFLIGILFGCIWGLNLDAQYFKGCNVVTITIGEELSSSKIDKLSGKIEDVLVSNDLNLYSVQLKEEGANTALEIKYTGKVNDEKIDELNAGFMTKLDVEASDISAHETLSKSYKSSDLVWTVLSVLLIMLFATIFVSIRHNLAYGMCVLGSSAFSLIMLLTLLSILRLNVSQNIFFILVFAVVYTIFEAVMLFENMKEVSDESKDTKDYNNILSTGMKNNAMRLRIMSIAMFAGGLLFVLFGTKLTRLIAINFLFAVVISLTSVLFCLPFIYNLTIDKVKPRKKKATEKASDDKSVKEESSDAKSVDESKDEKLVKEEAGDEKSLEKKETKIEAEPKTAPATELNEEKNEATTPNQNEGSEAVDDKTHENDENRDTDQASSSTKS